MLILHYTLKQDELLEMGSFWNINGVLLTYLYYIYIYAYLHIHIHKVKIDKIKRIRHIYNYVWRP